MEATNQTLVQLHWQDRKNLDRTEFVAQGSFNDIDRFRAWINDLLDRRGAEMPRGWCPLVMTEGDPRFVLQATRGLN